jgi:hypothetical protein
MAVKKLSRVTKAVLALGAVAGVGLYSVIVDLGVNAGRIHYGVTVSSFDVGGMTGREALRALKQRRSFLRREEICFRGPHFDSCAKPALLGWSPDTVATVEEALAVGREGGPFGALADRTRAWIRGVNVSWSSGPRANKVTRLMDDWARRLAPGGHVVDRAKLRFRVRRAILTYPRRVFRIPLER